MSLLFNPHFFIKYNKDTQKWFCSIRYGGLLLTFITVQDLSSTEKLYYKPCVALLWSKAGTDKIYSKQ